MGSVLNSYVFGTSAPGTFAVVGSTDFSPASTGNISLSMPAGIQSGDIGMIIAVVTGGVADYFSATGWATNTNNISTTSYTLLTKILDGSETTVNLTGPGAFAKTGGLVVFRGPTVISLKGSQVVNTASPTITGFTKAAGSLGIIALSASYGSGNAESVSSGPSGFTTHELQSCTGVNPSTQAGYIGSIPSASYTNGTNIPVNYSNPGSYNASIFVYELT